MGLSNPGGGGGAHANWHFAPGFPAPQSGDTSASLYVTAATTFTAFRARLTGGTGVNVDVLKNGVSILTAPLALVPGAAFSAGALATANAAVGDVLQVVLSGLTGSPTMVDTSLEGTRLTF